MTEYPQTVEQYTQNGWRIFPVEQGGKRPLVEGWQTYAGPIPPTGNYGVVTGEASGIVVLDIDPRHGGSESLAELEKKYGALPDTLRSITGNGGAHFFFAHPHTRPVRNGTAVFGMPGVDIRGDGGYVVVPPSELAPDKRYLWDIGSPTDIAELPTWLAEHGERWVKATVEVDAHFPEGTRNDSLARVAGSLRHFGTSPELLESILLDINEAKCNPPLPKEEVQIIARNIGRYKPTYAPAAVAEKKPLSLPATEFVTMEVEQQEWLVNSIWPSQAIGFIAGPPKAFKSFIALDLAFSISTGKDFLGRFHSNGPKRVLLIQQESSLPAFQVRTKRYSERFGDAPGLYLLSNKGIDLESESSIEKVEIELERIQPSLVVLDPLASFISSDENSASDMGKLVRLLRGFRDKFSCGICVVHHTKKGNDEKGGLRMRGSSALYAASEATILVSRVDEQSLRSKVMVELKEGEGAPLFEVEMDPDTCELSLGISSLKQTLAALNDAYKQADMPYYMEDDRGRG